MSAATVTEPFPESRMIWIQVPSPEEARKLEIGMFLMGTRLSPPLAREIARHMLRAAYPCRPHREMSDV